MKAEVKTWSKFLDEIGFKQRDLFLESNMTYMELMVNGISLKNILNACYRGLLGTKRIQPIEKLPIEEKKRLFEIVKEFESETELLDKEKITAACRSLYALEYYITIQP